MRCDRCRQEGNREEIDHCASCGRDFHSWWCWQGHDCKAAVTGFACPPSLVECREKGHDFSGPVVKFDSGEAAICALCGVDAMTVSLMSGD